MKKLTAILLTLMMVLEMLPLYALGEALSRDERSEAYEYLAANGFSVEKAMDAYAAELFELVAPAFEHLDTPDTMAFRKCVEKVYGKGPLARSLVEFGFDVAENDLDWGSDANERALYLKTLLLLTETDDMGFSDAVEAIGASMPDYTLEKAMMDAGFTLLMRGIDKTADVYTRWIPTVKGLKSIPQSVKTAQTVTKAGKPAAFINRLYDTFLRGSALAVNNAGKWVAAGTKVMDVSNAAISALPDTGKLAETAMSYRRMENGAEILSQLSGGYYENENLKAACEALGSAYDAFGKEMKELSLTSDGQAKLRDSAYLNDRLNTLIAQQPLNSGADHARKFISAIVTVGDVLALGGIVSFTANLSVQLTDLNFGTKSILAHFHAMVVADAVYKEMAREAREAKPAPGDTWYAYYDHARKLQRLCKLALMGENHIYELTTRDEDTFSLILRLGDMDWEKAKQNTVWFNSRKNQLENTYDIAQEYLNALDEFYLKLCLVEPDVTAYLGYEDKTRGALSGVIKQDYWFARGDGTDTPDYQHPNEEHADEALADMPVHLVVDEKIVASASTDNSGRYTLTFPVGLVEGKEMTLRIGDETTELEYAVKEISGLRYNSQAFRSSFPYQATVGETSADADSAEVSAFFPYGDALFLGDHNEYDHNLAIASLFLSAAAMNDPAADSGWTANPGGGRDANVRAAWAGMGFSLVESSGYDADLNLLSDQAAYTIATKIITDENVRDGFEVPQPQKYRVVGVAIRGDVNTAELAAVIASAPTGNIYTNGVSQAAYEIAEKLGSYLSSVYDEEIPTKVWITGFSRGGALTNAVSAILASGKYMTRYQGLYAYAFASPRVMTHSAASAGGGVFNLVYDEDLFAEGLFGGAGSVKRLGETVTFGAEQMGNYSENIIASLFYKLCQGNANYIPSQYKANTAPLEALNAVMGDTLSSPLLYARGAEGICAGLIQWLMLRDEAGSDPAETATELKHQLALGYIGNNDQHSAVKEARKALEGDKAIAAGALPDSVREDLVVMLADIMALGSAYKKSPVEVTRELSDNLVFLISTLMNDLALPFKTDSMAFGHHPEVYMAWLMGESGLQLAGKDVPERFNAYILPQPINLKGVVYDEDTDEVLSSVMVRIEGNGKQHTLLTDEKGEWAACVKPADYKLIFDHPGYEREIETVTKGAFDDAPVELETPLEPLPLNTVVMTTKCRYELYDHYDVRIVEPVIYSRQYPNFGAQVKEALRGIYDEAYGEIDAQRKWARECDYDMQTHYTSARPLQAYTNGRYFSLAIHHGYFDCSVGHDCTETTGFFFDMATGKQVRLDELMNPDNPEAESQFISLLKKTVKAAEAAKPGAEVNVSASSLYSHLIKGKYCAWSLLNDGLNIQLNGLNLSFGIYNLFIPYEELEGILKPECMPVKAAGESNYQFLRIDPADAADEKAEVWLNTQTVAGALDFDGVVDHLWVDAARSNPKVNSGCCWFYGFQMRNPLIFLPQTTDMNFGLVWQDAAGDHFDKANLASMGYPRIR